MTRAPRLLPLLGTALLASGCLPHDEQEIRFRIDAGRDRIDLLFVDRGLYHDSGGWFGSGPEGAGKDLDRIARGERWVSLLYGLLPLPIEDLETHKTDFEARIGSFLRENVAVEHGRFFRDAEGRLCWWQCVRLSKLSGFLDLANDAIRAALSDPKELADFRRELRLEDEESGALLRRALEGKEPFLLRRGGALAFSFPASREGYRNLLAYWIEEILTDVRKAALEDARKPAPRSENPVSEDSRGGAASRPPGRKSSEFEQMVRFFLSLEASFIRSGNSIELVLGNPERGEQTVALPRRGVYEENLAPHLEERKIAIHSDVTEATIRAAFEAFCAR
ncbi:MAG: hypothetical protein L0323_10405 [Planctomycetes bacterium]|nr:hypothetical protein [Planctomycetota bacterium]